jgi:hypothetical protein
MNGWPLVNLEGPLPRGTPHGRNWADRRPSPFVEENGNADIGPEKLEGSCR